MCFLLPAWSSCHLKSGPIWQFDFLYSTKRSFFTNCWRLGLILYPSKLAGNYSRVFFRSMQLRTLSSGHKLCTIESGCQPGDFSLYVMVTCFDDFNASRILLLLLLLGSIGRRKSSKKRYIADFFLS